MAERVDSYRYTNDRGSSRSGYRIIPPPNTRYGNSTLPRYHASIRRSTPVPSQNTVWVDLPSSIIDARSSLVEVDNSPEKQQEWIDKEAEKKDGANFQINRASTFRPVFQTPTDQIRGRRETCDIASSHRYAIKGSTDSPVTLELQEARLSKIGLAPTVRWIHIESPVMDLNSFQEEILKLPNLDLPARGLVSIVLEDVRTNMEKSSRHGKYLISSTKQYKSKSPHDPAAAYGQSEAPVSGRTNQEKNILGMFVSFPYIDLYAMAKKQATSNMAWQQSHPTRTLLQFFLHNESTTFRDLKQAILQMKDTPKDSIYHVPQLWCLLLGHDTIITCARSSASAVRGKSFKFAPCIASENPCAVKVLDQHQRRFIFSARKCSSWQGFIDQLRRSCTDYSNFDPAVYYISTSQGLTLTPDNWVQALSEESSDTLLLFLKVKNYQKLLDGISDDHRQRSRFYDSLDESYYPYSRQQRSGDSFYRHDIYRTRGQDRPIYERQAYPFDEDRAGRSAQERRRHQASTETEPTEIEFSQQISNDDGNHNTSPNDDSARADIFVDEFSSPTVPNTPAAQQPSPQRVAPVLLWSSERCWKEENTSDEVGGDAIKEVFLDDIHAHLSESTIRSGNALSNSELYNRVTGGTFDEFQFYIQNRTSKHRRFQARRNISATRSVSLAEICRKLLEFFLPCNFDCPEINKSMVSIIKANEASNLNINIPHLAEDLEVVINTIQEAVLQSSSTPRSTAPIYFREAFEHLVMFFILAAASMNSLELTERALEAGNQCKERLLRGKFLLFEMLSTRAEAEVVRVVNDDVDNRGILSMIMDTLISNFTEEKQGTTSLNARKMYNSYLDLLHDKVLRHPNHRVLQQINYLIDELSMVVRLLQIQHDVADIFNWIVEENAEFQSESPATEFVLSIGEKADALLERRIKYFKYMIDRAERLQVQAVQQMKIRQDDSSKAIMVFTIITTVFLPLTFVTSYLGMNTADIRDMNHRQGLFWEISLPLTFITLVISLVLAFFGDNVRQRYYEMKQLREHGR